MCVHYTFSSVWVAEWPLNPNCCYCHDICTFSVLLNVRCHIVIAVYQFGHAAWSYLCKTVGPHHKKTNVLHMRKQRHRSASW